MIDSLRELYRSSPRHTGAREDSSARALSGEHTHTHTKHNAKAIPRSLVFRGRKDNQNSQQRISWLSQR